MALRFDPMTEADARAILAWRYDGPYAVYNCPPNEVEDAVRAWLDPANGCYAVRETSGDLVGYCCFGPDARVPGGDYADDSALDVGLGLRPELTGKGLGLSFVQAVVAFAVEHLHRSYLRLTVAAFNQRAIRVYERAGFRTTHTFTRTPTPPGQPSDWTQMTRSRG